MKIARLLALSIVVVMMLGMVSVTVGASALPEITLEFLAPSPTTQVNFFDDILNEFYARTKDTLNVKINYTFTTFDDIGQKAQLKISSGEALDVAFVAQWTNPSVMQMISKDMLIPLDSYFADAENYPGLNTCFTPEYLRNNSFANTQGEYHVYGIPFSNAFSGGGAIYYRKDLADKYGVGDITDTDKLIAYFDAILENEKGMTPFTFLGSNDSLIAMTDQLYLPVHDTGHNYLELPGTSINVVIKPDGTAYAAKTIVPRLDTEYVSYLPEVMQGIDPYFAYNIAREWYEKGYVSKDNLSIKDHEGEFVAGKAASFSRGLDTYSMINSRLTGSIAGAELGCFMIDQGLRFEKEKLVGSDFKAWNFAAIPATTKNADRAMAFMNWLYASKENHDLFEYGIEGTHWIATSEDQYAIPEGVDPVNNYNFPGYILTWNPSMVRYDAAMPTFVVDAMKKMADTNFFYQRADAGFSFISDPIKTEMAKMNDLSSLKRAVANGVYADIPAELKKVQDQYDQAGYATVVTEVENQFNAFLLDNPYQGQ